MIVAGLLLTSTTSSPSARSALQACDAGIVELARLPDDDRTGADDQHAFEVGASRHFTRGWRLRTEVSGRVCLTSGTLASTPPDRYLRTLLDHLDEIVEQIIGVVRSG